MTSIDTIKNHPERSNKQIEPVLDTQTKACLYFQDTDTIIDIPTEQWCFDNDSCHIPLANLQLGTTSQLSVGQQIMADLVLMELEPTQNCPSRIPNVQERPCNWSFTQTSTSQTNCTSRLQLTYEVQETGELLPINTTPSIHLSGYFDEELQYFDIAPIQDLCSDLQIQHEGCSSQEPVTAEVHFSTHVPILSPLTKDTCTTETCTFKARPGRKIRLIAQDTNACIAIGCSANGSDVDSKTDCTLQLGRCENSIHSKQVFHAKPHFVQPQVQVAYNVPASLLKNISTMIDNELICGPSINSCKNPQIVSVDGKCNQDITIEQSINSDDLQFVDTTTPKGTTTANPFTHTVEPSFEQNTLTANFDLKARLQIIPPNESSNFCSGAISVSSGTEDKWEGTCGETCSFVINKPTAFTLRLSDPTQGIRWYQKVAHQDEEELFHCRNEPICPLGELLESTRIRLEQLHLVAIEPTLNNVDNIFNINDSPYSRLQNQFYVPCNETINFNISDEQSTELNTNNIHFTSWGANGVCPADSSCTLNPNASLTIRPVFYEVRPLRLTFGTRHLPPQNEAITVEYTSPRPATIRPINGDFDRTSCTRDDGTCTIYIRVVDQTTETLEPVMLVVSDSDDSPLHNSDAGVVPALDLRPFSRWYSVAEDCQSDRDDNNLASQRRLPLPGSDLPECLGVEYSHKVLFYIEYIIDTDGSEIISRTPPANIPAAEFVVNFSSSRAAEQKISGETLSLNPDEPYTVSILHPTEGPPIWRVVRWSPSSSNCNLGQICSAEGGTPGSNVLTVTLRPASSEMSQ